MSTRDAAGGARRYYVAAALGALITCTLIWFIHAGSFRTVVSAHGLLHTAIADRLAGSIPVGPPENPFFAGEPVRYYWFYHFVSGRIAGVFGTHPLIGFEILALVAAALIWFVGAELGRRLGWNRGPALMIPLLSLGGANAVGILILLTKLASRGSLPVDDGKYLWGLTHPILGLVRFNDPGALYGPLINFFLNTTSRPLALALAMGSLLPLVRYLDDGRPFNALGVLAWSAAATIFSPIIGLLAAGALGGSLVAESIWSRIRDPRLSMVRSWIAAAALIGGCVIVLPTYFQLFARTGQSGIGIGPRFGLLATILVSAGPLLALALVTLWHRPVHARFLAGVTLAGSGLALGNAMLLLPEGNDSNLFHMGAMFLAVPAAGSIAVIRSAAMRRGLGVALAVLSISTSAVVLWAYAGRPPIPLTIEGRLLRRDPADSPRGKMYSWIRASTADRAVFIVDPGLLLPTVIGNVPEFPALANRVAFVSESPDYMVETYEDFNLRLRIASGVLAGSLALGDRDYLSSLGRPVFVVAGSNTDTLQQVFGTPAFRDGDLAVFTVIAGSRQGS